MTCACCHSLSPCSLAQEGGKFFLFDASRSTQRHEMFFDDNVHFDDLKIVRPFNRQLSESMRCRGLFKHDGDVVVLYWYAEVWVSIVSYS